MPWREGARVLLSGLFVCPCATLKGYTLDSGYSQKVGCNCDFFLFKDHLDLVLDHISNIVFVIFFSIIHGQGFIHLLTVCTVSIYKWGYIVTPDIKEMTTLFPLCTLSFDWIYFADNDHHWCPQDCSLAEVTAGCQTSGPVFRVRICCLTAAYGWIYSDGPLVGLYILCKWVDTWHNIILCISCGL